MKNALPSKNYLTQPLDVLLELSPLKARLEDVDNPVVVWLGRELAQVWFDFSKELDNTKIIDDIQSQRIALEDYKSLLVNLRQQVSQGSRWLTRAASSMENSHAQLRDALVRHAAQEHKDYRMLEKDYVSVGGEQSFIESQAMNVGSEALSHYIFGVASETNPVGLFGATFVIEGLGSCKASPWCESICKTLNLDKSSVSFLYYHGLNDEDHYEALIKVLTSEFVDFDAAERIRRVAKVVAMLYALQLKHINNY